MTILSEKLSLTKPKERSCSPFGNELESLGVVERIGAVIDLSQHQAPCSQRSKTYQKLSSDKDENRGLAS
jgi:hypothetical protein